MKSSENYIIFHLKDETFAVPVSIAYEIIKYQEPMEVPEVKSFIKGVINVRGNIFPVIELREKFDMPVKEADIETVIILIDFEIKEKKYNIGMIVDRVSSIMEIDEIDILSVPQVGSKYNPYFVEGIFKITLLHFSCFIVILQKVPFSIIKM